MGFCGRPAVVHHSRLGITNHQTHSFYKTNMITLFSHSLSQTAYERKSAKRRHCTGRSLIGCHKMTAQILGRRFKFMKRGRTFLLTPLPPINSFSFYISPIHHCNSIILKRIVLHCSYTYQGHENGFFETLIGDSRYG